MQYEPYGETLVQRGSLDFAPKYNSQELDRETNFYFYNARYYDPQIARFTSADSVIDGVYDTQGWNRFAYVKGNPIRYKDPTGHQNQPPYIDRSRGSNLPGRIVIRPTYSRFPGDPRSQANFQRYRAEKALEERGYLREGQITKEALNASRPIQPGQKMRTYVQEQLTKDGSKIEDWSKYTTNSVKGPYGEQYQIHYYKHKSGRLTSRLIIRLK